jgi:hypothetical protein
MTIWGERFRQHALWAEMARARITVNALKMDPTSEREQDSLAYVGIVLELLERREADSDSLEVTPVMLDNTLAQVAQWNVLLDNVLAGVYAVSDVIDATDGVMTTFAAWPPMKPARYLSGIQASVEQFSRKVSESLAVVSEQASALNSDLLALTGSKDRLGASIDTEKQRISEAIADFKTQSVEKVEELLAARSDQISDMTDVWSERDMAHRTKASEILAQLHKHEATARKTVHATTALVVATDYGKYARNKTWAAWICDIGAALVGAAGVGTILWHLFTIDPVADSNLGLSLTRLAASLGTLGIAALLGRRGAQHHKEARAAKRTDLALRRVMPFIVDLPEDEQQLIVLEFTDRVFIRGDLDSSDSETDRGFRERILALRKEKRTAAEKASVSN